MTGRRQQLQARDLANPATSARELGDLLKDLYLRVEACERRRFEDITIATDASQVAQTVTVPAPSWPVVGVNFVRMWNETTNLAAPLRPGWSYSNGFISVTLFSGDTSPSTTYALRLELCG